MADKLDFEKNELIIGLDSFNEPTNLVGKNAWIKLITNIIFTTKGTYPSMPNLGVGIQTYDFTFMEDAIDILQAELMDQTRTYLPDIPINSIVVDSTESGGKKILLIIITLIESGVEDIAVIASSVYDNIIDFEVSM